MFCDLNNSVCLSSTYIFIEKEICQGKLFIVKENFKIHAYKNIYGNK